VRNEHSYDAGKLAAAADGRWTYGAYHSALQGAEGLVLAAIDIEVTAFNVRFRLEAVGRVGRPMTAGADT